MSGDKTATAPARYASAIGRLGKPVVEALVGAGEAQLNPHGGVKVDPVTLGILRRNGRPNPNLFTLLVVNLSQIVSRDAVHMKQIGIRPRRGHQFDADGRAIRNAKGDKQKTLRRDNIGQFHQIAMMEIPPFFYFDSVG